MVDRLHEPPGVRGELRVGLLLRAGEDLALDHRPERRLRHDLARPAHAADREPHVLGIGEIVRIDQRLLGRVGRGEPDRRRCERGRATQELMVMPWLGGHVGMSLSR